MSKPLDRRVAFAADEGTKDELGVDRIVLFTTSGEAKHRYRPWADGLGAVYHQPRGSGWKEQLAQLRQWSVKHIQNVMRWIQATSFRNHIRAAFSCSSTTYRVVRDLFRHHGIASADNID